MEDSAVLFIDSPDRKGLVARVSGLLYEPGGNILHAGHHRNHELGRFFMRVENQTGDLRLGGGTWSAWCCRGRFAGASIGGSCATGIRR